MKKLLFFSLALSLLPSVSHATIWRVNNNGFGAQFKSLEEVNNAYYVTPGDTIHLEGSNKSYGYSVYVRKKLVILGAGYNVAENPNVSADGLETIIDDITFDTGSSGSRLMGVHLSGGGIKINVSNIQISRCKIENEIALSYDISDIRITQNYFSGDHGRTVLTHWSTFPTNVVFNNNIVHRPLVLVGDKTFSECNNNVFDILSDPGNAFALKFLTGSFRNNILTKDLKVEINKNNTTNVSHNIGSKQSPFGKTGNNLIVEDMAQLFVSRLASPTDAQYQLKPNSAGSGKGSDGSDIGAFGGAAAENRYVLSGLPPIPVIYGMSTTGIATQTGLPVTIKARIVN